MYGPGVLCLTLLKGWGLECVPDCSVLKTTSVVGGHGREYL